MSSQESTNLLINLVLVNNTITMLMHALLPQVRKVSSSTSQHDHFYFTNLRQRSTMPFRKKSADFLANPPHAASINYVALSLRIGGPMRDCRVYFLMRMIARFLLEPSGESDND